MSWNRPSEKKVEEKGRDRQRKSYLKGLLAGLGVVVGAGIAAWFVFSGGETDTSPIQKKSARSAIKEMKPVAAVATNATRAVAATNAAEVVSKPDDGAIMTVGPHRIAEIVKVVTNADFNQVVLTVRTVDGKIGEVVRPARPPVFTHGTDQLLALTLCHDSRVATPPLPGLRNGNTHDQDFLESLKEPILVSKDDSEEVAEQKRTVREARKQIKDLMDQGYHFDEILDDYERLSSENREIRNKAMRELKEIHSSGDRESAEIYREKINAAFETMGIDPLDKPGERKGK